LVRHGAAALLSVGEWFFCFENLCALEVAELDGPALDARADQSHCVHELGMDVARHNLRGEVRGAQAEGLTDGGLDSGRKMRVGSDGATEFADSGNGAGAFETLLGAAELIVHERKLEPEGNGFGMNAVTAANAGNKRVLLRAPGNGFPQCL